MDSKYQTSALGEPDLRVEGLQLWIHERQFPDSKDYCDGNWLIVTARCCASQADVSVNGPILHLSELHSWMVKCEACMPHFWVRPIWVHRTQYCYQVENDSAWTVWVYITPDHLSQSIALSLRSISRTFRDSLQVSRQSSVPINQRLSC